MASISSINTIHGATFFAFSNNFLTREAPRPANISINSEPLIEINGTFASPAIAFAIKVLPVPGFPQRRTPLGTFAPISVNLFGSFKKSTISIISLFSSSNPATSSNLILDFVVSASYTFPLSPSPCILNSTMTKATSIIVGNSENNVCMTPINGFCFFCTNSI